MNYTEMASLSATEDLKIDPSLTIRDFNGQSCVDGFVAIPISFLSNRYKANEVFEIVLAAHNNLKCFLVSCKGEAFTYGEAAAILVAAYLSDSILEDISQSSASNYIFKSDYVVLESQAYHIYVQQYRDTSAVWGSFSHESELPVHEKISEGYLIRAIPDLELPTQDHKTATFRAIHDSTSLGHYLALFHLIELSFDYDLVQDITTLGTDLKGIGKLLANYNNSELQRLIRLVKKYWTDEVSLEQHLKGFFQASIHDQVIDDLLYAYDKDGFPWAFKDNTVKRQLFIVHSKLSFSKSSFEGLKLGWTIDHLQKSVAYIIYRFRCAIAHASIGEHILTVNDSRLVAEKAEPLLMGLISQMYKKIL